MEEFFRTSRGRNIKLYHICILRYPGAVNLVWLKRRRTFSRTGERCSTLNVPFRPRLIRRLVSDWAQKYRKPASVALLLCPSYNMLNYGISSVLWVPFSLKTRLELSSPAWARQERQTVAFAGRLLRKEGGLGGGGGVCTQATLRHPHFPRVWKLKVSPPLEFAIQRKKKAHARGVILGVRGWCTGAA